MSGDASLTPAGPPRPPLVLVVLAAGLGSRMRSSLPKPFHLVAGIPMIDRVVRAGAAVQPDAIAIVVSEATRGVREYLDPALDVTLVDQPEMRGTGDAVRRVFDAGGIVPNDGVVLVVFCDHPLLDAETVQRLADSAVTSRAPVTLLTCVLPEGGPYGRIERDEAERPIGVIERADDDLALRAGTTEVNSGMMALRADWAATALTRLTPSPKTGELYLTELISLAVADADADAPWPVGVVQASAEIAHGVNDRVQLAAAEEAIRDRVRRHWMLAGVTIDDPATTYIDDDVEIGRDTVIRPFSFIRAGTTIGERCEIGPGTDIAGSTVADEAVIIQSRVRGSTILAGADIGPYSHVRGGSTVGPGAHIGSFGELKNASLGAGVKAGHFGYLGDVTVGPNTNIGAGTVTANFDGTAKHQTTIGSDAFIASDTILRAPVTIGDGAATGAGSVVTHDVAPGDLVVGVPARRFSRQRPSTGDTTGDTSTTDHDEG